MLYNLFSPFMEDITFLNVFRYLTFRSGGAILTALIISFIFAPSLIQLLKRKQKQGQPIREDGPSSHLITKQGTPTMGGIMILLALGVSSLLWSDLTNSYIWIILFITFSFGLIGFLDDYLKVIQKHSKGLPGKSKLLLQILFSIVAILWIQKVSTADMQSHLALPFFKNVLINLGWFYIPFTLIVIIGASNAVNLTDGLDGLAIVPIMIAIGCFALISYLVGHAVFADYLQIHHVKGVGELAVFCSAMIGAGLGFLWFNAPPARVFMGDTGSLALGGAIGAISVITHHELVLVIIGGLFVMEAISVIMQVISFKLTGKRIFKMAPIHHHFEKKGWAEPTIVIRFWVIAIILALIGLSTLKLR